MITKKISPSQVVKFLFPDAYKEVPDWILEKAADFGKDLHESIQTFIEHPDLDEEITDALITDNKIRLYKSFKEWFKEQEIKETKTEYYVETENLHGYLDLLDDKYKYKFWDYKFRNVDNKLNITKDIIQMKMYQMMLLDIYKRVFSWELVFFDKKTGKIFIFKGAELTIKQNQMLETLIKNAIRILEEKNKLETFTKNDLTKWEHPDITELKYEMYFRDGEPGKR